MKINNLNDFLPPMDNWKVVKPGIDMSKYESPIEMIVGQIQTEMDNQVIRAIQNVDVHVDKDELIKALNYDRQQYDVGYKDGYNKGFHVAIELVKQNIDKAISEALEKQREDYTQAISDIASKING